MSRIGSGRYAGEDTASVVVKRDMTAGSVRRIVGRMSIITGHGMPERAKSRSKGVGHDVHKTRLEAKREGDERMTVDDGEMGKGEKVGVIATVAMTGQKSSTRKAEKSICAWS